MTPTMTSSAAGTSNVHRPLGCTAAIAATRMPMNIAMPPTSGISPICCLRPPGLSVMRRRSARGRSVSVRTTVTANASAVDDDSPKQGILYLYLPTAPEHPEILLDDPALPQPRYTPLCSSLKAMMKVTFLSHRLGAVASV